MNQIKEKNNIRFFKNTKPVFGSHNYKLKILNNHINIQEIDCSYVSPYSLFMIENYPLNFTLKTCMCDYGAGTGILGIAASFYGVSDITSIEKNEEAYQLMKINYYNNTKSLNISFFKDEFECTKKFDSIVCNPASLPSFINSNSFCDGGDYGIDMILNVVDFASRFLSPKGKLYIIITSILPLSIVEKKLQLLLLKYRIIAKKTIPFRDHYKGISEWVDNNKSTFPEMYYINYGDKLYEDLFLFEIERSENI